MLQGPFTLSVGGSITIKIITAVRAFTIARTNVITFCKSRPFNWQLEDNNQQRNQASLTTMTTRLHDTSLNGVSIVETSRLL